MGLEPRFIEQDTVRDKIVFVTADRTLEIYEQVVRVSADGDSGANTITLPSVSNATGKIFSIVCRNADGTNDVTIQDQDDSECWAGDITLDGKCDRALLYSDGMTWWVLYSNTGFSGTTAAATTTSQP